jgi:uncharacterized protein YkwD
MKKKISCFIIALLILFAATPAQANNIGDVLGNVLNTNIRVFINGIEITGYNIDMCTYVVAEDLAAYGISVRWNAAYRMLSLTRGESKKAPRPVPINYEREGSIAFRYIYTDIVTYINGRRVTSYNVQGSTVVKIDDVAAAFGQIIWNGERRELYASTDGTAPKRPPDALPEEIAVLRLVNIERFNRGLRMLEWHDELGEVARAHSRDMSGRRFFDHDCPDGLGPYERKRNAGIDFSWSGENIAAGQRTPEEVVNDWMNSPGHRSNILYRNFTHLGVGFHDYYWTQKFKS